MRMLQVEIFIGFLSSLSPFSSSLLHCLPSTLPLLSLSLSSLFLSRVWLGERFIQGLSWTIHRLSKWFLMMAKSFISRFKRLLWWRNVCVCLVTQSCLTLCNPVGLPFRLFYPWGFSRQEYWSGLPCPLPGDLPNPGIELRSSTLQTDSLPSEPHGKPKNTGVGSLLLLQGNFQAQESNQGLLHCSQILYQVNHQGSPDLPVDPV